MAEAGPAGINRPAYLGEEHPAARLELREALAALVAKWRETATVPCDGSEWDAGATYMLMECADQLAALLTHEAP